MTDLPDLRSQDDYDEWVGELAEREYEEFVDYFTDLEDVDNDDVLVWVEEAPMAFEQDEVLQHYRDIVRYTNSYYTDDLVLSLPSDDPLDVAHDFAIRCIRQDVTYELRELLWDRHEDEVNL